LDAFLEESSFNTTVLSREGSNSTFPSGVKVIRANYDSLDSLKSAFQGQDAVLSLVGGNALGDQNKLIDAAIAAGVKRFLPSEYGSNTPDEHARKIVPMWEAKVSTVNYLKSKNKGISWTSIVTGNFFDWGLRVGFMGFDGPSKTATIFDDGETIFATTTLHQVGIAAVKSLKNADLTKNQYVYVAGFMTSQNEILAAAEKVTGAKWTVNKTTAKEEIKVGRAKVQKGDYTGIKELIQSVNFGKEDQLGDFSSQGLWNEKLGVPKEDLEETVRAVFA
jgi:hypothetical protein